MLPELLDARIGHLLALARDAFGILKRRSLARREPIALPVAQELVELLARDAERRADGATDVHSIRASVERSDVHVQQGSERRVDPPEPLQRGVEPAEPQHERNPMGHEPLRRGHLAEHRLADPIEGADRQPGTFDFADRWHGHPPGVARRPLCAYGTLMSNLMAASRARMRASGAMEQRRLGRTDIVASVLGFGGSEIGYQGTSGRTVARVLGSALDAGLNVIDTAECYEDSETLIGKAIGSRRREFYLFTNCGHAGGWARADWRQAPLVASIERSLRRLATDYLDLIQLHSCSLATLRTGEAIEALERAPPRGWTRYIGYRGAAQAAPYAVDVGSFGKPQTSIRHSAQTGIQLTLPFARAPRLGVVAQRPPAH